MILFRPRRQFCSDSQDDRQVISAEKSALTVEIKLDSKELMLDLQ
jgi:hypothetical protein